MIEWCILGQNRQKIQPARTIQQLIGKLKLLPAFDYDRMDEISPLTGPACMLVHRRFFRQVNQLAERRGAGAASLTGRSSPRPET